MSNHQAYTYCHTCKKKFHYLGIASHRAKHRQRQERCVISYSDGRKITHYFDIESSEWDKIKRALE